MSLWTWAWILWIALFFVIEIPAIRRSAKGDTLSENIRSWFSIKDRSKGWVIRRALALAFVLWFGLHIFFE